MKIVVIGAGSFVFGPSVLAQTYCEHELNNVQLALVDPDFDTIALIAQVGLRMAAERGVSTAISTHRDCSEALEGADFVINCASPQMKLRNKADWAVIDGTMPGHVKTEFGGIAGISYSLRQIALIESIASDMSRLCPHAWLLNIANPLPRVCQAAHERGIRTAGFCVVSSCVYSMLWEIFYGKCLDFPFSSGRNRWSVTTAGLNHFAWLIEMLERQTGRDVLPELRQKLSEPRANVSNPRSEEFVRSLGYLLAPGDSHTCDFLPPDGTRNNIDESPWHGSADQRRERHQLLRSIADGDTPFDRLLRDEAWEKPLAFINAFASGKPAEFHAMNLINESKQVSNLPDNVFVETPCRVERGAVTPKNVTLPDSVLPLCERTALVTDTIVRAARERKRSLVHEAVILDPTIVDKTAGITAINLCLAVHGDILPHYT